MAYAYYCVPRTNFMCSSKATIAYMLTMWATETDDRTYALKYRVVGSHRQ